MAKNAAPAKLTGGAGFRYEDHVAARLFLDMLGGANSLGEPFGRVVHLDWQARDAGWHLDDLAVRCSSGAIERAAGLSIKSDRQVTSSGFPEHFVTAAWEHWFGLGDARRLRADQDVVVLITGQLADGVDEAWQTILRGALETTPERMVARLTPPPPGGRSQSSEIQRALFTSLRCPSGLPDAPASDDVEAVRVLRHVRLLRFDFESPTSRDVVLAVGDAQRLLTSGDADEGHELWHRLIEFAAEQRTTGGATDLLKLLNALRARFVLVGHPDYAADQRRLAELSAARVADIRDGIAGLSPLPREAELGEVQRRINGLGVCFITGESGGGKSALTRRSAEQVSGRTVWLEADDLHHADDVAFRQGLGLANAVADVLLASPGSASSCSTASSAAPLRASGSSGG